MTYHPKKGLNSLYVVLGAPRLLEVVVVRVAVPKALDSKLDMKKGEVVRMGEAVMAAAVVKVQEVTETEPDQPYLHPSGTLECGM